MTTPRSLAAVDMPDTTVRHSQAIEYKVHADLQGLKTIESEWNDLWGKSRDRFITHSYDFTVALYKNPLRHERERMWCLEGRLDGKLVLVWPFIIYRHFAWRVVSPVADTIDYNNPLMDETLDGNDLMLSGISVTIQQCPADLIQFTMIRFTSGLKKLVEKFPSAVSTYSTDVPMLKFHGFEDFQSYEQTLGKSQRSGFARKRRRLMELGGIEFTILPHTEIEKVINWIIPRKNSWLRQKNKNDETHMSSPNIIRFVIDMFKTLGPQGLCRIFALLHKGEFVAIDLIYVGRHDAQWYFGTYNPDYEKYSPGILLKEHIVRWAFDHKLNYDMQRGFGNHKTYFANYVDHATTFRVPCDAWGHGYTALRRTLKRLKLIH